MRRSVLAALDEQAQARIVAAVNALVQRAGLHVEADKLMEISERDPKIQALRERQFVADILETLAEAEPIPMVTGQTTDFVPLDDLEAVDGVGPALMERIREHFNDDTDDDH